MTSLLGKRLGVYELEEELGRGAMGVVYRGRQVTLDRVVAVKVLLENLASDESFVARFIREARLVASLNHPNIVHVYDAGRAENLLYFAMEYISGPTVSQLLKQKGKLPLAQAVDIAVQVAAALDYAHAEARLVHRDIKPENMILDRWGKVKVVDFGLARVAGGNPITRVGTVVGSLYYVSPEQLLGHKLDGRADVYALGVALYEMLTGQRPFRGKNLAELSHAIIAGPLAAPGSLDTSIPEALETIICKAMERDRERRYGSAGEFEAALHHWVATTPQPERKVPPTPGITMPSRQAEQQPERKAVPPPPLTMPSTQVEQQPERKATPPASSPAARPWAPLGKPRPDPSLPAITLTPLSQPPTRPAEPPAAPAHERPPRLPAKPADRLPPAQEEPAAASSSDPASLDAPSNDLLKTAASQFQRLVSRLKKE